MHKKCYKVHCITKFSHLFCFLFLLSRLWWKFQSFQSLVVLVSNKSPRSKRIREIVEQLDEKNRHGRIFPRFCWIGNNSKDRTNEKIERARLKEIPTVTGAIRLDFFPRFSTISRESLEGQLGIALQGDEVTRQAKQNSGAYRLEKRQKPVPSCTTGRKGANDDVPGVSSSRLVPCTIPLRGFPTSSAFPRTLESPSSLSSSSPLPSTSK